MNLPLRSWGTRERRMAGVPWIERKIYIYILPNGSMCVLFLTIQSLMEPRHMTTNCTHMHYHVWMHYPWTKCWAKSHRSLHFSDSYREAFPLKTEEKERKGNYSDLEVPENPLLCWKAPFLQHPAAGGPGTRVIA